jgi:hypothetical protein
VESAKPDNESIKPTFRDASACRFCAQESPFGPHFVPLSQPGSRKKYSDEEEPVVCGRIVA